MVTPRRSYRDVNVTRREAMGLVGVLRSDEVVLYVSFLLSDGYVQFRRSFVRW